MLRINLMIGTRRTEQKKNCNRTKWNEIISFASNCNIVHPSDSSISQHVAKLNINSHFYYQGNVEHLHKRVDHINSEMRMINCCFYFNFP